MPYLSGTTSDFKSRGREFKSRWGQTKIYLKKILPWGISISSYFESLGGLLRGLDGPLPITFYFNPFGHPVHSEFNFDGVHFSSQSKQNKKS